MKKLSVLIQNREKILYLDNPITATQSVMMVKHAAVYWNYNNIKLGENDTLTVGSTTVTFEQGYWNFAMIKDKLKASGVLLEATKHDNKCMIQCKNNDLNLLKFAPLLGFPVDKIIPVGTWIGSPQTVNVNLGLKYLEVRCNIVRTSENYSPDGSKSSALALLPIPTDQSLNGSVTFFRDLTLETQISNGFHNRIVFEIVPNIDIQVDADVLLELYMY